MAIISRMRSPMPFSTCSRFSGGIASSSSSVRPRLFRTYAIRCRYRDKFGLQSPFVYWELLGEELLEQALDCLPAAHLRAWFERLLEDIPGNRAGLPDLIQFWPAQRRYRMVEVKGPGDRLQDNQLRWLQFCREREMPVAVCYVRWHVDD